MDDGQEVQIFTEPAPTLMTYPPLQAWKVWLLCMATFSFYVLFWMLRAARDLKAMDGKPRLLWLWFLSPLFAISLPFTFANLGRDYGLIAGSPLPRRHFGGLLGVTALLMSAGLSVSDLIEIPVWLTLVFLISLGGCLAAMQDYINKVKQSRPDLVYRSPAWRYTNLQRVCICCCGLVTTVLISAMLYLEIVASSGDAMVNGQTYRDEAGRFQVTIVGDDWRLLAPGTYTDGSADLELQGPLLDMNAFVFTYGPQESLNFLASNRIAEFEAGNPGIECREERTLRPGTLQLVAEIQCSGRAFGEETLDVIRIISDENGMIEIVGHLAAVRGSFGPARTQLVQTVTTFGMP